MNREQYEIGEWGRRWKGRLYSDWGAHCDNTPPQRTMKNMCMRASMNWTDGTYTKQPNYKDRYLLLTLQFYIITCCLYFFQKCISNMFSDSWPSASFPSTCKQTVFWFTYAANEELLQLSGWNGLYQEGVFMVGDSEKRVHETWISFWLLKWIFAYV